MCTHVCTDAHSCAGACAMHAYVKRGQWSTLGVIPQEQTTLVFDTGFLSGTLDSPSRLGWLFNEHKGSTWQDHPRSVWDYKYVPSCLSFCMGSRFHGCHSSSLLAEPSSKSKLMFLRKQFSIFKENFLPSKEVITLPIFFFTETWCKFGSYQGP